MSNARITHPVTRISEFLTADHRRCDALFDAATPAGESGDWDGCRGKLEAFAAALRHHMAIEEQVLFPAFEQASGIREGPTSVMRHEHRQMLALLDGIAAAVAARDAGRLRASAQSFAALMDAHSAKEENVLYPMCDEALPGTSGESLSQAVPRSLSHSAPTNS